MGTVRFGVWITLAVCSAGAFYCVASWTSPHRARASLAERIAATAGLATFPVDGTDREELHRHADAELYAAKHGAKVLETHLSGSVASA